MERAVELERVTGPDQEQWRRWGSYVCDRSWGTVRENSPAIEEAWKGFPFEQARSRTYVWSEDGIAGFSDSQQRLCMTAAFWNGKDPILKERFFGLANHQSAHAEDVKDYYFQLDGTPSYSYMKLLYKYPQVEFPYDRLLRDSAVAPTGSPTVKLVDTLRRTFAENRYFDIVIEYAKAGPDDILCRISVTNRADEPAPLHILPHLFYRNTWQHDGERPQLEADGDAAVLVRHPELPDFRWYAEGTRNLLFTENESNTEVLHDQPNESPYVKDGIDYAVVRGQTDRINPKRIGTKCAAHYVRTIEPGKTWVIRTRLTNESLDAPFKGFDAIFDQRKQEADAFYAAVQAGIDDEQERQIQRTAFAGLCWNNMYYHFNVRSWLKGVPNWGDRANKKMIAEWRHFDAHDVLSVPDPWEYPWLAAWDIAFQAVTLAMIDPEFGKQQLLLLLDKRWMRPDGALPAFEGDFTTPHPPVHCWAVWRIYQMTGRDETFLREAYGRLKLHFDWWMREHRTEEYLFNGGFLGKDNISLIDRNKDVPEGGHMVQADSSGWMIFFALHMLLMAVELGSDEDADDYLQHFLAMRKALQTLWDSKSRFFFDEVRLENGKRIPLKVRTLSGMIPLFATVALDPQLIGRLPHLRARFGRLAAEDSEFKAGANGCTLLTALPHRQIRHLLGVLLDPDEFFAPYGLRSVSLVHKQKPVSLELNGKTYTLKYEPGEATDDLFGGNSNWRGPVWAPLNHVAIEALYAYNDFFRRPQIKRGKQTLSLDAAAKAIAERLVAAFRRNSGGRRPAMGPNAYLQTDPHWQDLFWFYEYFNPETGQGLGASHQNGWTAFIALAIQTRGRPPEHSVGVSDDEQA